jgi:uncharacterized protein YhbP (UPF0306 family)
VLNPAVFDLSTFQFTRVGFLKWDQPLPGGQVLDTRIDTRPDMNIAVDIYGDIDPVTGEVEWWFHTVDPLTGYSPDDPYAGFLPPYDPDTGYNIGWMEFSVQTWSNLPSGTQVTNQAVVQFDFMGPWGPAPPGGPWLNTIDSGPPSSQVLALPAIATQACVLVQWSGQDEPGGSGVAGFDIYVQDNNGPWTLWQTNTTNTSAMFYGQSGHTYAFYSVAHDYLGHIEATPLVPDTTTTVSVEPALPPNIGVQFTGQQAELSWPTSAISCRLEVTESLSPAVWTTATNEVQVVGGSNIVHIAIESGTRFYRLANP